ncbi:hypothetical protein BH18ACT11_BH18ACT11_27350 [soil metagenome]
MMVAVPLSLVIQRNYEPLYYDGVKAGEGRVEATQPMIFSADEWLDVGCETGTAVASECEVRSSAFSGELNWVELKVGGGDIRTWSIRRISSLC